MLCYNPWHIDFKYLLGEVVLKQIKKSLTDCAVLEPKWSSPGLAVHVLHKRICGVNTVCSPPPHSDWVCLPSCCSPALLSGELGLLLPCCWVSRSPQWYGCIHVCVMGTGEKWIHYELTENVMSKEEILSNPPNKMRVLKRARVHKKLPGLPEFLLINKTDLWHLGSTSDMKGDL